MDDLDESDLPNSQASVRVVQPADICIRVSEKEVKYREKLFPEPSSVLKANVRCTACGTSLLKHVNKGKDLFFHPLLQVLVCEDCRAFYGDGDFALDDDNSDTYCRWCAQGGSLYCCSACNFVFCQACIRRNFKRSMMEEIEEEDWKCFVCNPESLWMHRAICWTAREYVKDNPEDGGNEEEMESSNEERKREKRKAARENSRKKEKSSLKSRQRTRSSKHSSHQSREIESSDDGGNDNDDDNGEDNYEPSTSKQKEKKEREKDKYKKKEVEKHHGHGKSRRKGKEESDESHGSDSGKGKRHKLKKLKERDKGQKHEKAKGNKHAIQSLPRKDAGDNESGIVVVREHSTAADEDDKEEEARQIAVLQNTCLTLEKLTGDAAAITFSSAKKTKMLHDWISKKTKVPSGQLPTTPVKCTKLIETFKKVLCKIHESIEELQGKVSEAEKEWMNIVKENQEDEGEMVVDGDHDKVGSDREANENKQDNQEKGESFMNMTSETRLVNGDSSAPEDISAGAETAKDSATKDSDQLDDAITSNVKNLAAGCEEEKDSGNNDEEGDLENGFASDCDRSLASALTVLVDTNGKSVEAIEKESEGVNASSCHEKEESSPKRNLGQIKDSSAENNRNGKETENISEEKISEEEEGKSKNVESEDDDHAEDGITSDGNGDVEKGNNIDIDLDSSKNNEKDNIQQNEERKSSSVLENSIQDLFAAEEDTNINVNNLAESLEKVEGVGNSLVVGKDTSVNEEQLDGSDFERTKPKVKPTRDDVSAKIAFLLDTSASSGSDSTQSSKTKKSNKKEVKVPTSGGESDSEIESDSSSEVKKVSRTKKAGGNMIIQKIMSQYDDEKLKAGCFVSLERVGNGNYKQSDLKNNNKKGDSMMRAINRLGNLANLDKVTAKSDSSESEDSGDKGSIGKKRKKRVKKPAVKNSKEDDQKDSSENENDLGGSDIEKISGSSKLDAKSGTKMLNALAAELLANSSSFDSSSSDSDFEPLKKKAGDESSKSKAKKKEKDELVEIKEEKNEESESTDLEALPSKASWKRDTLLRAKLSETDSSEEERKWRKKKENEKSSTRNKPRRRLADSDSDVLNISSSVKSCDSSDFEVAKNKRKRKVRSDSSSGKSSGSKAKKKKKLRRIQVLDSESGSEKMDMDDKKEEEKKEEEKEQPVKGKKNFRKLMKGKLAEETKAAAKDEEERLKRIAERQKLYNDIFTDKENKEAVDPVVLDFDPDTKKPLVSVHPDLLKKLKPHQAQGVKFMWEACFESLKRIEESKGSGCILAHCMGLGKTLQVITLVHTLLTHPSTKVQKVLVICPLNTVLNWINEFKSWLKDVGSGQDVELYELTRYKANVERMYQLKDWQNDGGVMVLGYEMYRNLTSTSSKRIRQKFVKVFQSTLVDPGPDLVICDEGHLLKNIQSALSKAVNSIKTAKRIVLTGTPLQNNLKEYHCMIQFVKPSLLGTPKEFVNRFVSPITNGQLAESTPHDVRVMKRRAHVLHKMLEGCVQRRDYQVLTPFLPPKYEYVIGIQLTELQSKLYIYYLENFARMKGGTTLFNDFQNLQRIWTHPRLLKIKADNEEKKRMMESDSEGSLKDFIDDDDETTSVSSISQSSDSDKKKKKGRSRNISSSSGSSSDPEIVCINGEGKESEKDKENKDEDEKEPEEEPISPKEWWENFVVPEDYEILELSGKLVLLFDILQKCEMIGDKVLVFSQSLISLDVIEHFLENVDDLTQKIGTQTLDESENSEKTQKFLGSWSKGLDYFRIDGSVSPENRSIWCKSFNRVDNLRARLFLISTRAGGMGINLIGANRVILFDASWNPSNDLQSIFRIYRFGQSKPCYVYRFLAQGTMEEKIYNRQITKLSLALRVVDEHQIERHFNLDDLQELYRYDPNVKTKRPTPMLPKDRLLAELIQKYPDLIDNYHEHDSLLENKTEEELTEDERKAAWEDFENDKKGVLPATNLPGGVGGIGDYGGVMPQGMYGENMFAENTLALREAILKMHPNATEEQIAIELRHAASRISHYFSNPSYPQMQPYFNHPAHQIRNRAPINMYASQASAFPQQMPLLQNYGLQNYYHNPVVASSLANQSQIIPSMAGSSSRHVQPGVTVHPMQFPSIQTNISPQDKDTAAVVTPLIKIRSDLMAPFANTNDDNDIIIESVKRREN